MSNSRTAAEEHVIELAEQVAFAAAQAVRQHCEGEPLTGTPESARELKDRFIAAVRALSAAGHEQVVAKVTEYEIDDSICVERVKQRAGSDKWAVRRLGGEVLNKQGEWEYEPMPSSRDDAFIERCRFDTALSAIDAARAATST